MYVRKVLGILPASVRVRLEVGRVARTVRNTFYFSTRSFFIQAHTVTDLYICLLRTRVSQHTSVFDYKQLDDHSRENKKDFISCL